MAFTFERANNPNRKRGARIRVLTKLAKHGPSIAAHFTMPERSQLRDLEAEELITINSTTYQWSLTQAGRYEYQKLQPVEVTE